MEIFPNKKTKKAFSLTEISIVITIIGIIIAGIIGTNLIIKKFSIDIALKRPKTAESVMITFTPQLKDNLILWLDSTNKNSFPQNIIDQDQISYWQSINFIDTTYKLTQSNQANMPTYHEYGINNLPSIYFDGNDFLLKNNLNSQLTKNKSAITIFVVLTFKGSSAAYIYDLYNPATNILFSSQINNNYSSTSSSLKLSYGSINDEVNSSNHESLFDKDQFLKPQIITLIRRDNISQILVNNNIFGNNSSSNNSNLPNNIIADFYLGSKNNSSLFFNGYIAELIIFNKGLSDDQVTHINKYLSKKWQIKLY